MSFVTKTIICLPIVLAFAVVAYPQGKLRKIDEERFRYKNTPISVAYQLKGQPFSVREGAIANPEWIRDLTLTITNISGRSIRSFTLQFIIEKQGTMEARASIPVYFPFASEPILDPDGKPTGRYKKQIIKPGESVTTKPIDQALMILDIIKERDAIMDISTVFLDIRGVSFEDGTKWNLGVDFIPDPNNPGRHIRKNPLPLRFK